MGSETYCNGYLFDILFVLLRNKKRHYIGSQIYCNEYLICGLTLQWSGALNLLITFTRVSLLVKRKCFLREYENPGSASLVLPLYSGVNCM